MYISKNIHTSNIDSLLKTHIQAFTFLNTYTLLNINTSTNKHTSKHTHYIQHSHSLTHSNQLLSHKYHCKLATYMQTHTHTNTRATVNVDGIGTTSPADPIKNLNPFHCKKGPLSTLRPTPWRRPPLFVGRGDGRAPFGARRNPSCARSGCSARLLRSIEVRGRCL